jgi:hypothetical protein
MIAMPDAPTGKARVFRIAVFASLLVHLLAIVFAFFVDDGMRRFVASRTPAPLARKRIDEIVTISSALRFEKRARPVPASRRREGTPPARSQHVVAPQRPIAQRALPSVAAPERPSYVSPSLLEHELANVAPASARPDRSTQEPAVTPERRTPPFSAPPDSVAPAFSQERLAQIDRDLAKTIAQVRSRVDPMRTIAHETPAAPVRYRVQMKGKSASLHHGQGTYVPIKSWHAGGFDYYYVTYEYVYPDGTYETGSVPWPIHFRPASDPFANDRLDLLARTPLPLPPTDFVPPGTLGKALRVYFPNLRFSDAD